MESTTFRVGLELVALIRIIFEVEIHFGIDLGIVKVKLK